MKRIFLAAAIAILGPLTMAPMASARGRVVIVGGYGFYHPWGYGWYGGPAWGPYWGPGYGYYPQANAGNVKIETHMKGESIFVDGGFAGVTGKLKKFPLRPGTHTIALRDSDGRTVYQESIEVIRGRTIEIHPDFNG